MRACPPSGTEICSRVISGNSEHRKRIISCRAGIDSCPPDVITESVAVPYLIA